MSSSPGNGEDSLPAEPEAFVYSPFQIQMLEEQFLKFPYPSDMLCRQIGEEIELTESQVKFWFSKRNRFPCNIPLGTRVSFPNNQMRMQQPPLGVEPYHHHFGASEIVGSSVSPSVDSSGSRIVGSSLAQIGNLSVSIEIPDLIEIMVSAKNELVSLLQADEPFWVKNVRDEKYVIHRNYYDRRFSNAYHKKIGNSSYTRFESSKDLGFMSINAKSLVTMLSDSNVRMDMFSTILNESVVLKEYATERISPDQLGPIQLVYEQMHMQTPLLKPRDFYYLRCCEKIGSKTWVIVEVSYDLVPSENMHLSSYSSRAWRLPSGCLVKEAMPTLTKVIWVEHVQVDDSKSIPHQLYRDIVLRGLSFDANRFLQTLLRSSFRVNCHIMFNKVGITQHYGAILSMTPEARRVIVDLSSKMVKNFCGNLTMKNKINLPYMPNDNIRFSICKTKGTRGEFLINAATSMWIPLPFNEVVDFINDVKMRSMWDVLCNRQHGIRIATITYGKSQENSIAIIKPPAIPSTPNLMLIQETLSDPLGAVVLYAPIEANILQKAIDEAIPPGSSLPPQPTFDPDLIPSGFIIYKDGSPGTRTATSNRSYTYTAGNKGSLITAAFQIRSPDATSVETVDMTIISTLHSLVTSTVQNIKNALNYGHHR